MKKFKRNYIMNSVIKMIRKAVMSELDAILEIYAYARSFMAKNGNPTQWGKVTPKKELLIDDINQGKLYVVEEDNCLQGVFFFNLGEDPTYKVITQGEWLSDEPYGVIHRIASAGKKKGVLKTCIDFCLEKTNHLRIDTHENNTVMHHLLNKYGFSKRGIIFLQNGEERIAYEYIGDTKHN